MEDGDGCCGYICTIPGALGFVLVALALWLGWGQYVIKILPRYIALSYPVLSRGRVCSSHRRLLLIMHQVYCNNSKVLCPDQTRIPQTLQTGIKTRFTASAPPGSLELHCCWSRLWEEEKSQEETVHLRAGEF